MNITAKYTKVIFNNNSKINLIKYTKLLIFYFCIFHIYKQQNSWK